MSLLNPLAPADPTRDAMFAACHAARAVGKDNGPGWESSHDEEGSQDRESQPGAIARAQEPPGPGRPPSERNCREIRPFMSPLLPFCGKPCGGVFFAPLLFARSFHVELLLSLPRPVGRPFAE